MVIFDSFNVFICSDPEDVDDDNNLENLISEGVFKNIRRPTMQLTSCYPKWLSYWDWRDLANEEPTETQ